MPPRPSSATATTGDQQGDLDEIARAEKDSGFFTELGSTGLKRSTGYVDEEFLPQLRGRKAVQVYREMSENDPIVGAELFAIQQLLRGIDWNVVPAGKSVEANKAAKLVETAKDDMSHSWSDFVTEVCSMLPYGWAWHETVYKRRMGPWQSDGRHRSKYSDGLIGWRKLPIRAQETLQRWVFDDTGGITGMVQMAPPKYETRYLPITRGLLFRWGVHKGNPEGRSILRNAYRPWFFKKRLEEFEAIGVERDLAGLPMVKMPASYLKAKPGTDQYKMVQAMKTMIRSIRRNEQEGVVFPTAFDEDTRQPLFDFELLGSGGARQFSTNELIQRYEQRMLMTVLADWILVGHEQTGTYNMHVDKTGIFRTALNATADGIADVFNRHAIPRLFALNGWRPSELPTIQPSNVEAPDLGQLTQLLSGTSALGFNWFDADMDKFLRQAAGLPDLGEEDYRRRQQMARKEESTRFVEAQTGYLTARSQLAQAMANEQMQAAGEATPDQAAAISQSGSTQAQGQMAQEQHEDQRATASVQRVGQWAQLLGGQQQNGPSRGGNK